MSVAPVVLVPGNEGGLVGEPGGRGSGCHWLFASSSLPVKESKLIPPSSGWRGEVGLLVVLDPGTGLLDPGTGLLEPPPCPL